MQKQQEHTHNKFSWKHGNLNEFTSEPLSIKSFDGFNFRRNLVESSWKLAETSFFVSRIVILLFFILVSAFCRAQVNLVINPSFEDTVNCPFVAGDINKAIGWNSLCGSPDYFNICSQNWGIPSNVAGFQQPASGIAYAGFITWSDVMANTREFPSCSLVSPLVIGTKYFISFKVVLDLETVWNPSNSGTDKIGLKFTMGTSICNSLINNSPPVFTNAIITDSLNWTRITGSFVADSAYTMASIGNFFDDANTDTTTFFNSWWSDFAYYYLDDVCISTDSMYANNYVYTGVTQKIISNKISCYPNPFVDAISIKNSSNEKMDVEIYNILGEQVYTAKNVVDEHLAVNLTPISSGIIFIKITSGKQISTYKLLKQ